MVKRVHGVDNEFAYLLQKKETEQMSETYSVKLDPSVKPVIYGPRRQPAVLLPLIKDNLREMEAEGHPMKASQVCLDPTDLNKAVKKHYPIPKVNEIVFKMLDCNVCRVLDTKINMYRWHLTMSQVC